jgi:hypothetical protein
MAESATGQMILAQEEAAAECLADVFHVVAKWPDLW